MPETPAPILARNSHSSTTCGSVAAWRISVTPSARGGRQQRRLGAGHRRLVEIHRGALAGRRAPRARGRGPRPGARPAAAARRGACRSCAAPESRRRAARCAPCPTRASSGPSSSTEPRSRPTSVRSGAWVRTRLVRDLQRGACRCPRPRRRGRASRRAITSTSPMRGTLVSTHSSSVSRQAASSGSAAFLLPSTATRPSSRWPPSISSVDISSALPADSPRPRVSPAPNPRNTGSGRRRTPKRILDPARDARRQSAPRRRRVAPPRFTIASGCFVERPTAPSRSPRAKPARSMSHAAGIFTVPSGCAKRRRRRAGARRDPLRGGRR